MRDTILVKGARENNLKNVDLEIPRDKFVVFTGLTGSGKSSLAFATRVCFWDKWKSPTSIISKGFRPPYQ